MVHHGKFGSPMSVKGQKRTCRPEIAMSALPPKADIRRRHRDVSFGPNCDICTATNAALFNHLVGPHEDCRRNRDAKGFGGFEVENPFELSRLFNRQIGCFHSLRYSVNVFGSSSEYGGKIHAVRK